MRSTIVEQEGIRITQEQSDNVVIEMNGCTITLTEENTESLRIMLYDAYRSKQWKYTRKEKSAHNKALWALARAQGKKRPDKHTQKAYEYIESQREKLEKEAASSDDNMSFIENMPEFEIPDVELPDFLKKDYIL